MNFLDEPAAISDFLRSLHGVSAVAVDTEFMWQHTYRPIPALLQFSSGGRTALIDATRLEDAEALRILLEDRDTLKILHSCEQDLLVFHMLCGGRISPVFDTQVAHAFSGGPLQASYAKLAAELLGLTIEKDEQNSDWLRRPLTDKQLAYAANDVLHLEAAQASLVQRLKASGRAAWFKEESRRFDTADIYNTDKPEDTWLKLSFAPFLTRKDLPLARELCAWRESTAVKVDLRPRRLLTDDQIGDIVRHKPATLQALAQTPEIHEKVLKRHGAEILAVLDAAAKLPLDNLPPLPISDRLDKTMKDKFDAFAKDLDAAALEVKLDPSLLASRGRLRAAMAAWLAGQPYVEPQGWRAEILMPVYQRHLPK